jgi:hypothetical protein
VLKQHRGVIYMDSMENKTSYYINGGTKSEPITLYASPFDTSFNFICYGCKNAAEAALMELRSTALKKFRVPINGMIEKKARDKLSLE